MLIRLYISLGEYRLNKWIAEYIKFKITRWVININMQQITNCNQFVQSIVMLRIYVMVLALHFIKSIV